MGDCDAYKVQSLDPRMGKHYKENKELIREDRARYFLADGDEGYVKKHNDHVIADTIKKYEAMQREKMRTAVENYGERAEAVVTYLKAVDRGKEPNIPKYFGKKYLAFLRGDEIKRELMSRLKVIREPQK